MHRRSRTRIVQQLLFICFLIIPTLVFSATINQKPYLIINNSSAAIVDLDGDGYLDIVIVAASDGSPPPPEPIIVCIELPPGEDGVAKKTVGKSRGPLPTPPPPPPPDRGLWVHVLDGAPNPARPTDPPYSQELSPNHDGLNTNWPKQLAMGGGCGKATSPTVAVKDIDFSGSLSVVVGGPDGMYAYGTYGALKPGFPGVAQFPPFYNAPALRNGQIRGETAPTVFPPEATTLDGLVAILGDDNSTYHQRWNGVARRRHCQFMGDIVYSSPSSADVGKPSALPLPDTGVQVADGVPDEISAADGTNRPPNQVTVYAASDVLPNVPPGQHLGMSQDCDLLPPPDRFFLRGAAIYSASPAVADMDGDLTQDIVMHGNGNLQLFASNGGTPVTSEYALVPGTPKIQRIDYSSPAVVNLSANPAGAYDTIVVTSDGGVVSAFKYYTDAASCLPGTPPCLKPVWQTTLPDAGAISASPVVARLQNTDNGRPQVIVANDAGKVYVLQGSDGSVVDTFGPLGGTDDDAAVFSTPAIWTRKVDSARNPCQDDAPGSPTNCPIIVTGNRHGLFEIVLVGYPPFNPDPNDPATVLATQWPTFHRSNTRTGALVPSQDGSKNSDPVNTHNRGSIGGVVDPSCEQTHVKVYQHDGTTALIDYYTGVATDEVFYNHRYVFELVPAVDATQSYKVRFNNNPANDVDTTVEAGKMTRANHATACSPP